MLGDKFHSFQKIFVIKRKLWGNPEFFYACLYVIFAYICLINKQNKNIMSEIKPEFKLYSKISETEIRPITELDIEVINNREKVPEYYRSRISISQADREKGSPKIGDMIARNPKNHDDTWLVEESYFNECYRESFVPECCDAKNVAADEIRVKAKEYGVEVSVTGTQTSSTPGKKWDSLELLNYINNRLTKTDGDLMYIEFENENSLLNAIAERFGFKQDGSFKMVAGIHDLSSGLTEDTWRLYGKLNINNSQNMDKQKEYTPGVVDVDADKKNEKNLTKEDLLKAKVDFASAATGINIMTREDREKYYQKEDREGLYDRPGNVPGNALTGVLWNSAGVMKDVPGGPAYLYENLQRFSFGVAIAAAKEGKRILREGWNGSGMFLYYVPAAEYPAVTPAAKRYFGVNGMVPYRAYWALKTAQGDVAPWSPSGSDSLADDWIIID